MEASILIVEDDRASREFLRLLLDKQGFTTRAVTNGVEALVALESDAYDLVLSDVRMPQMDGMELLSRIAQRWPELPVVLISANTDLAEMIEAVRIGAINYIVKPAPAAAVNDAVRRALTPRTTPNLSSRSVPQLIGTSKEVVEVRHLVALAARADVSVLLTGEQGTGRALAAQAIHRHSCLANGPLVRHHCAEDAGDSFESDFFGHLRGAYDGASEDRMGLLSQAHGGVLYLENVSAIPIADQSQLLRAIEACELRPLGANESQHFSVRFIASTTEDPRSLIADNALREDLYYRLRGFEIHLPSLRDRAGDIPALVEHFLGPESPPVEPEALALLSHSSWPGNVRQLEHTLTLAARRAAGEASIGVRHISLETADSPPLGAASAAPAEPQIPHNTTLRDLERRAIIQAMKDCLGNRSKAARMLGIDRSTLRRKILEFEIEDA